MYVNKTLKNKKGVNVCQFPNYGRSLALFVEIKSNILAGGDTMSKPITITWLGHSCFRVRFGDYRIILDPYKDGTVPGVKLAMQTANEVYCSHEHADHGYVEAVSCISTEHTEPYYVEVHEAYHDDAGGSKRGKNKIHVFVYDDLHLAHFGDLGAPLTEKQLKEIGPLDVIMVPVGGHYTITGQQACELAKQVGAKVVIPMHYRSEDFGFPVLSTLEPFLACAGEVKHYDGNQFEVSLDTPPHVAILKYVEETVPELDEIELI